ncbi:MAG TPA: alkaline phosphatase family protein, partial [Candidatus Binatia bacterium]|nr:alkaline phosphatase family protein [Candidatus Binatia bacterium]
NLPKFFPSASPALTTTGFGARAFPAGWSGRSTPLLAVLLTAGGLAMAASPALAKGRAEHVVVVVWDGMRPDFIRPEYAPNLYTLATNGVYFKRHHPAYISSTEVNGTALATGVHPGRSGLIANSDYNPEMNFLGSFATEGLEAVLRGDLLTQGNYLRAPTVAEILQESGIPTIIAGSKPVALLHDRSTRKSSPAEKESVTLFEGKTLPRSVAEALVKVNDDKAWNTNVTHPNKEQDGWTTRALIRGLWKKGVPQYTLLWLSEPDKTQHETGVGSSNSLAAIETSDKNLGDVVKALSERGVLDKTDLFVVSDHGFSTILRGPNVVDILKRQKFTAGKKFENPEPGDVMVVGLGGSVLFYVMDRVESVIRRLVEFLQTSDFAGVIFSRIRFEGTFPLEAVHYDADATNHPPDVILAMRWSADRNDYGFPGMFLAMDGAKGKGSHASLSRFDMNNTLVASGPDFRRGLLSEVPSGNIDLAPTVLWILGVKPSQPMDGRVLFEALATSAEPMPKPVERRLEASHDVGYFHWTQYLKFSEVGGAVYFDEGNGEAVLKSSTIPD